jgi:hypothetical protein
VARELVSYVGDHDWGEFTPIPIDDCWIGADLALYVRYRGGDLLLGKRVDDLHLDVTGGGYAIDAASQARNIFHDLYGPPPASWTDRLGYRWSGPAPEQPWEYALDTQPRIATVTSKDTT